MSIDSSSDSRGGTDAEGLTCDHHDNCIGNHDNDTSGFWCDHDQHCDLDHNPEHRNEK